MKYRGKTNEYFEVTNTCHQINDIIKSANPSDLFLLWFKSDHNLLVIDGIEYTFNTDDIISLTEFHKVEVKEIHDSKLLRWNKDFFCVLNHDSEVGCKGILFYGASDLPVMQLSEPDAEKLDTVWKMLEQEMESNDGLQEEMLQMMLKRILILCTRIYKSQTDYVKVDKPNSDIIREYNFLVEQHFKVKHTVADYAEMLFKSPKTLSNLFKKMGNKTPLQFIQDRKMLEARRLLSYTDKSVSEIGYELGFSEVQSFSRFFKKQAGMSPADFKK